MIAREGLIFIISGLIPTIIFIWGATRWNSYWLLSLSVVFALLTLFTTFFFRDPDRTCPVTPNLLIAPADGKVVAIKNIANHPFIGGEAIQISIFLSITDVHINRVPVSGSIDYVRYNPGKFFAAYKDKASELNEQTEIGMTAVSGYKLIVKQIAGVIARRIVCRLKDNDSVMAGQRFGMIRFGSRTDLIIPAGSRLEISRGNKVHGGETIIGYLPEKECPTEESKTIKENDATI